MLSLTPIDKAKCQKITKDICSLVDLTDLRFLDMINGGLSEAVLTKNYNGVNVKTISTVDDFWRATKADIRFEHQFTYYAHTDDLINIPEKKTYFNTAFMDATENFYTNIFHELIHWTGAKHRLNRKPLEDAMYSEEIAYEELIAELGSSYLAVQFNVSETPLLAHASYIKRFLEDLDCDKDYIIKASKEAFESVEYLNGIVLNKT